jgi:hypothetical protein
MEYEARCRAYYTQHAVPKGLRVKQLAVFGERLDKRMGIAHDIENGLFVESFPLARRGAT